MPAYSQIPANKLYINIGAIQSTIYTGVGPTPLDVAPWVESLSPLTLSTAGAAVLRDMGKTIYLPVGSTGASVSSVLRKVQLVTNAPVGTGNDATDSYYTGYIELGGLTYGGGNGTATMVARLN